jgi:hypothetical protein
VLRPAGDGLLLGRGEVEDVNAIVLAAGVEALAGRVGAQGVQGGDVGVGRLELDLGGVDGGQGGDSLIV